MVTTTQIRRYAWVVELLLRRKGLTIKEINDEWSRSSLVDYYGETLDRKSWYKCFDDIGFIYNILIESENKKSHNAKWFILNPEIVHGNDVEQWMLGCMAYRNLLDDGMGLCHRIDIEGFPSENGMMEPIVQAMREDRKLDISYKRYGYVHPKHYIVEPYVIKSYRHRFYVLCKFATGLFYTLSFDRILKAQVLKEKFSYPNDIFAQNFFEHAFGVMMPKEGEPHVDIIIRAKGDARYYLADVPLHHSQVMLREGANYADFRIHIWPTDDFIGAILQQGDRLEILEPANVRLKIKERLESALLPYHVA